MESIVPIGLITGLFCVGIGIWLIIVLCIHNTKITATYYRYDKVKGHIFRTANNIELRILGKFNLLSKNGAHIWDEGTPLEVLVDKNYKSKTALSDRGSKIASMLITMTVGIGLIYLSIKYSMII